jgi:hypothetical protein
MVGHFLLRIATRRRFSIDIAKDLAMEHLCVLQLETALATLVTTWFPSKQSDVGKSLSQRYTLRSHNVILLRRNYTGRPSMKV